MKKLITNLQERCDIYAKLMEMFVETNIEIITQTNDVKAKSKLSKLMYDINDDVKRIQMLIDEQDKIV